MNEKETGLKKASNLEIFGNKEAWEGRFDGEEECNFKVLGLET